MDERLVRILEMLADAETLAVRLTSLYMTVWRAAGSGLGIGERKMAQYDVPNSEELYSQFAAKVRKSMIVLAGSISVPVENIEKVTPHVPACSRVRKFQAEYGINGRALSKYEISNVTKI